MPSTEELIRILQNIPLFSRLDRPQLRQLVRVVKEVSYAPHQIVCSQGELGTRYHIILSGAVQVTHMDLEGRVIEVRRMWPGDTFGETSLLLGDVRDATVETLGETVFLCIDREDFEPLLSAHPGIERALRLRPDVAERRRYLRLRFKWLEPGEVVVKLAHRHAFTFWERAGLFAFFAFIFGVGGGLLLSVSSGWLSHLFGLLAVLVAALLFLVIGYFYWDWRNDIYVLTTRRVVHRERVGITSEQVSAVPIQAVQNVQMIQEGPLAPLLGFGDLLVETAGAGGQVVFRNIAGPQEVQQTVLVLQERALSAARLQEREAIRRAVRRHFLLEEEATPSGSSPAVERKPRLVWLRTLWQWFFPSSWHREGMTITWRRHPITMLEAIWLPAVVGVGLTLVILLLETLWKAPPLLVLLYGAAMFIIIPWFIWRFEDWQNDFLQVTATRIIQVDRLPLLLRERRREAALEQVTTIRFDQGLMGKILGYGDIFVETASPVGTFHFQRVAHPQEVHREIFANIDAARRRLLEEEARRRREEIIAYLSVYDEIRRSQRPASPEGSA